jgi:hypothetical protein
MQNFTWGTMRLVWHDHPDMWIIINTPGDYTGWIAERTLVIQMEPLMADHPQVWGVYWASPPPTDFWQVITHTTHFNWLEWHLSATYMDLLTNHPPKKYTTEVSAIVSSKYTDPGHRFRVDFIRDSADSVQWHLFGADIAPVTYKGALPYHAKDNGLMPYKYTFAAENNQLHNYVTEKLVDAILAECVCFYWGSPNVGDLIDTNAYVVLPSDCTTDELVDVMRAEIASDGWERRIGYIRAAKWRLLNEQQLMPKLERLFNDLGLANIQSQIAPL